MCFGCSKEPSHRDGSFEYPQQMFWLRKKIQLHTLIWGPEGYVPQYQGLFGLTDAMDIFEGICGKVLKQQHFSIHWPMLSS